MQQQLQQQNIEDLMFKTDELLPPVNSPFEEIADLD